MTDSEESVNIEWKQTDSAGKKTRNSRRFGVKSSARSDEKLNELDVGMRQIKSFTPNKNNVNKMRSKIREVFDEDEDEEDEINTALFLHLNNDENSSLLNGLKEDEKQKLQVDQTIKNQSMQQDAGKMEAIMQLDKKLRSNGIKKLSENAINENMLRVETDQHTFVNTAKQHIEKTEKIKTSNVLDYNNTNNLIKGLSKVKKVDSLIEDVNKGKIEKLDDVELVELGKENNDKEVAETIYYKTGRKKSKHSSISREEKELMQKKIEKALKEHNRNHEENIR